MYTFITWTYEVKLLILSKTRDSSIWLTTNRDLMKTLVLLQCASKKVILKYNLSPKYVVIESSLFSQNVLLSDSSSDEEEDGSLSREQLRSMLRLHRLQKQCQKQFHTDKDVR